MTISFLEVNIICYFLAVIVAGLALSADSAKAYIFDAAKAVLLAAGGIIAGIFNWEGNIFVVTLVISGIFMVDHFLDSVRLLFVRV